MSEEKGITELKKYLYLLERYKMIFGESNYKKVKITFTSTQQPLKKYWAFYTYGDLKFGLIKEKPNEIEIFEVINE